MSDLSSIKVNAIKVIEGPGSDEILLDVDLPLAVHPFAGTTTLKMLAAQGTGMDYVERNFRGVPISFTIDVTKSRNV